MMCFFVSVSSVSSVLLFSSLECGIDGFNGINVFFFFREFCEFRTLIFFFGVRN